MTRLRGKSRIGMENIFLRGEWARLLGFGRGMIQKRDTNKPALFGLDGSDHGFALPAQRRSAWQPFAVCPAHDAGGSRSRCSALAAGADRHARFDKPPFAGRHSGRVRHRPRRCSAFTGPGAWAAARHRLSGSMHRAGASQTRSAHGLGRGGSGPGRLASSFFITPDTPAFHWNP